MAMGWTPVQMGGTALRGSVEMTSLLLETWLQGARTYLGYWGPLGQPAIAMLELIAGMQRQYLAMLSDTFAMGEHG